jgi:hypothetical protein
MCLPQQSFNTTTILYVFTTITKLPNDLEPQNYLGISKNRQKEEEITAQHFYM